MGKVSSTASGGGSVTVMVKVCGSEALSSGGDSGPLSESVTVTVAEQFPAEWRIVSESYPHEKVQAFQAEWRVPVPAEGSAVLAYRVRVTL